MNQRILMILTSSATMGESGTPTGLWLEEFTVPYLTLVDAGYWIDVASTAGGAVPIDPRSSSGDADQVPENSRYRSAPGLVEILRTTRTIDEIRFADYDAVFMPGGHGTMWDLPNSEALSRGISETFAAGKPVAAVCHGPAGLINAKLPDGRPLVAGRWVSAFTTEEEIAVGLKDKIPFLLDERLASLGARLVKGEAFEPTAVAHGNLLTGQNPSSAREVAALTLAALRRRAAHIHHAAAE